MSSNRRASQAQLGFQPPRDPQETPQTPQEGFGNNFQFFQKIQYYFKPPGGGSGGSPGALGRVWGGSFAWKTEKLVDSMTSKLPPAPKFGFSPVLRRPGSARLVRRSKNAQKTEDNALIDSRNAVFCRKNGHLHDHGRPASPPIPKKWHFQAKLASPRLRNLATDPQVGPNVKTRFQARRCHSKSCPVMVIFYYTRSIHRVSLKTSCRHCSPSPSAAKRQRGTVSKLPAAGTGSQKK